MARSLLSRRTATAPRPRRRLVLPAALIATALVAAACGGGDDSGDDGDGITLRMTWWGSDSRHAYTQQLIDMYEAENPGITIEPEYTGFSDYWDKLATSVAGDNAPDIMQQDIKYVREYAGRGALLDLSSYLGGTIENGQFDPAIAAAGVVDGVTYAIPTGVNAYSVVADPAVFDTAGVDLPDDTTWSWDDYWATAKKISESTPDGTFGTQNIGYVDAGMEIFARQHGESLYKEDGSGLNVSKETLTAWWQMIVDSRDGGAEPPASMSVEVQGGGVDQSLIATGKGGMANFWTNELPALSTAAGHELKLLRYPGESQAAEPGMFLKPAMFWSIGAKSKHPEEAAAFVNWLLNSQEAADVILSDRGQAINLTLREAVLPKLTEADAQSAEFLESISEDIQRPPALPPMGWGDVITIIQQLNEQVLFDQITPAEAADQFLSQAGAAIS